MAQIKIHKLYTKRERVRKHLYYLYNRIYRMEFGRDREGYFRWKFVRQEDQFDNDERQPVFDQEALIEARNELQDEMNNNI